MLKQAWFQFLNLHSTLITSD